MLTLQMRIRNEYLWSMFNMIQEPETLLAGKICLVRLPLSSVMYVLWPTVDWQSSLIVNHGQKSVAFSKGFPSLKSSLICRHDACYSLACQNTCSSRPTNAFQLYVRQSSVLHSQQSPWGVPFCPAGSQFCPVNDHFSLSRLKNAFFGKCIQNSDQFS